MLPRLIFAGCLPDTWPVSPSWGPGGSGAVVRPKTVWRTGGSGPGWAGAGRQPVAAVRTVRPRTPAPDWGAPIRRAPGGAERSGGEASAPSAPKARAAPRAGRGAGRPPSAGSRPRAPAATRARRAATPTAACGGWAQAGRRPPEPAARPGPPPARPSGARAWW